MKHKEIVSINRVSDCHSCQQKDYQRHGQFEILWFTTAGCHKIDHQKHTILSNSIFLIGKGQVHQLEGPAEGYAIGLSSEFFQYADNSKLRPIFNPFNNDPVLPDEETTQQLTGILALAVRERQTTHYPPVINSYLEAFIYKLYQLRPDIEISQDRSQRLEDLFALVENYYLTERKAGFYADRIGLTSKRLNEILKNKVGLTLTQLLHKVVVAEAKKMLARGDKSIKEVSFELRFSEQAYFSRFFKNQTGMSPEKFSRLAQED